jgi:2-polyprenyl-3-methyl-5-hydroxy-6-metoxy-1,4-benzoquinol methylase
MTRSDRRAHWENVYQTRGEQEVSWFQDSPQPSLDLIARYATNKHAAIVDIGGGTSRLVDALLEQGFDSVSVLDLSQAALDAAQRRLGTHAANVQWIAADVTVWQPSQRFDVWHDRAALHFLTEDRDRDAYLTRLHADVAPGGHAIIGTFASDGPERCSGLPVQRYDPADLAKVVGPAFELIDQHRHRHVTPRSVVQSFQFSVLRRR